MKTYKLVVCLAAVFAVAPLLAYAQSEVLQFNVPFDFMVGKAVLPAGHYVVKANFNPNNLTIRNEQHSAVIATQNIDSSAGTGHTARLLFRHFDGHYVLAEMWGDDQTFGRAVPVYAHNVETRMAKADVVEVKAGQ